MSTTSPHMTPTLSSRQVHGGLVLGVLAVSSSAILATVFIGDPGSLGLAVAAAFWRCLGGAVSLAPFALRANRRRRIDAATRRLLGLSGLFLALHFALFLGSLAFTTVASATTLATMSAVFVALGGRVFLGEQPTARTRFGMAITLVGAVALGLADASDIDLGPRALLGDGMAFLSAMAVSGYLLIGRSARPRVHASIYSGLVYASAASALLMVCLVGRIPLWGYSTTQWWALIGLIVGPQLLGHTVFNTLMSSIQATIVAIATLAEPAIATLLAWALLEQVPSPLYWVAAPVVIVGAAIAIRGQDPG